MRAVAIRPRRSPSRSKQNTARLAEETRQLLSEEIDFIPSPEFQEPDAYAAILGQPLPDPGDASNPPKDLPAHLARMCATPLLRATEERELFRRMNYLKFRANVIRSRLDPDRPDAAANKEVRALRREATEVRDRIIQANMRLVISVIKKLVGPQFSFDDLLSDGIVSMMHAVDKFDYDRGFRFSTYAYRAITRNAMRMMSQRHRENAKCLSGAIDAVSDEVTDRKCSSVEEAHWTRIRQQMTAMLDQLDRREKFIVRSRYALGSHRKVRTFQNLADKLGVSKERVRQLEQRAVSKLKSMAVAAGLSDIEVALP